MIIHKAVHKQSLEWGIMSWYHYRRLRFAVTASRVRGSITEPSQELHGPGCSHTSAWCSNTATPHYSANVSATFSPLLATLTRQDSRTRPENDKNFMSTLKDGLFTGSYTQILPAETAMEDILALPDPQQRFRIDLAALRTALRR